jgi:uncharacterized protein
MIENLELHVISAGPYSIILHPPTYTILKAGKGAGQILEALQRGVSREEICRNNDVPQETIDKLVADLKQSLAQQGTVDLDPLPREQQSILPKLELMVSNDCNLNCLYCYAQGGDYGRGASLMAPQVARKAIDRVLEHFQEIQTVVFFGGEPLLNLAAIKAACQHLLEKQAAGKIKRMPYFGTVTNGTLLTEAAIEVINKYKIDVTVSIDGPKEVNDKLRPFRSGTGSYASIKRGVERLRARGIHPHFELTYTQKHVDAQITPADVLQHLEQDLGFSPGYGAIGDADVSENDPLKLKDQLRDFHAPLLDWSLENFMKGDLLTGDLTLSIALQIVFKQPRTHICPAGYQSLAVNASGDIYPCHILVDRDEFAIGNIEDPKWFHSPAADRVFRMLENSRKQRNPYCSRCWARYICWGCLGRWKSEGSESVFISASLCKMKKQIWEMIIRKIMALKDDDVKWARFEDNVKKIVRNSAAVSAGVDVNRWADFGQEQSHPVQTSFAGD